MSNLIQEKSYQFSVEIIELHKILVKEKKEYVLSKQVLKSGTSIGANVEEAIGGYTRRDFRVKMGIAYKEARETTYWLKLLKDTNYIDSNTFEPLFKSCKELCRILFRILESSK